MTISARALWYSEEPPPCLCSDGPDPEWPCADFHDTEPGWPTVMRRGSLRARGRMLVCDKVVLMDASELENPTEIQPAPPALQPVQIRRFTHALVASYVEEVPDREFPSRYLVPLEAAGYRIRALRGQPNMHGIVDPAADRVVGLIMPVRDDRKYSFATRVTA